MSESINCAECKYTTNPEICIMCIHSRNDMFKPKPKKKVIDLSMMVGSDIDMEFTEFDFINPNNNHIGKLVNIDNLTPSSHKYDCNALNSNWSKCRIRQDHWHHWNGGECPLPEGLEIEVIYRDSEESAYSPFTEYLGENWDWNHNNCDANIIAFKVLGTAENYKYEWMEE